MMRRTLAVALATIFISFSANAVTLIGDGVADDTEALQYAVDHCGGLVELPAGLFRITTPVVVDTANLGFRGIRGANGATKIIMEGGGPAFKIVGNHQGTAAPHTIQDHSWEKERFPVIEGIGILGAHPEADGIELFRTLQCTIRGVQIRKCRYGVHLVERNRNFILANSHIYDGGDTGLFLDHCNLHQAIIIGNHISYNKRAGIRQLEGDVHNIQITGNDIEYNSGGETPSGEIVLESYEELISEYTITGNTLQATVDALGANILIIGQDIEPPSAARTITITGNVIGSREKTIDATRVTRMTIGDNILYGGTTMNLHFKNCRDVIVNANTIGSQPSMHAISRRYIDGVVLEDCADCILSDNILHGSGYGSAESGGAVNLLRCRSMRITDNHIVNPAFRGIYLQGDSRSIITDNSVVLDAAEPTMIRALELHGDNSGAIVRDNIVDQGAQPLTENLAQANVVRKKSTAE